MKLLRRKWILEQRQSIFSVFGFVKFVKFFEIWVFFFNRYRYELFTCINLEIYARANTLNVPVLSTTYWWLVELPMWLTDGFLTTFSGSWRGQCAHTLIPCGSCVAPVQDGGGKGHSELRKTRKVWKTSNFYKGAGEH